MLYYKIAEDVELRLVEERYAKELTSLVTENLSYLGEWLPWANENYNKQSALEFLKKKLRSFAKGIELPFLIFQENRLVGLVSLFKIDDLNKSAEIGYWLAKDAQGKGVITKCCKALTKHGFDELNLNRIVIICATGNIKSQAVPGRLKFKDEGVFRESLLLHDEFIDLVVYSLLKEEWENI